MAEPLAQAASRLAECCALLAIGYNLKQSGILRSSDGETAIKVATTLTLPSVIVQSLGNGGTLGGGTVSLLGVATVCLGAQLAATWLYCMSRPARERAVLSGTCTGLSLRLWGYPLVDCFLGGPAAGAGAALQAVALVDIVNHLAVWVGSYLLFAGAGPAFPESFKHEDGGDYRGQWRGMRKEGLGAYSYASGARYEGEWRNNVKEGRGVYYFPKGGVYEGEWSGGSMNGLGVRTFSTGQVKAGRWHDGQLETPLELWQVALAADGATAVAAAARSVEVGGGRPVDAAHQLAAQPTLWALLAGVAINVARVPLPTSVDLVTGVLAHANTPLMLLAAGITAPALAAPRGLQQLLPDISRLLGPRLLVPLTVGLALVALLAASAGGAGGGGEGVLRLASASLVPLAAALMALLAPVPPQALANARRFRLNESTAAAITAASYIVCVPLMLLAGVAACAAGLAAPPGAATADARPLGAFTLAAIAGVSAAVGFVARRSAVEQAAVASPPPAEDRRILMVYAGPPGTAQSSPSVTSASTSMDEGSGPASTSGTGRPAGNPGSGTTTASPSTSAGTGSGGGGGSGPGGGGGADGGSSAGGAGARRPPPPAATATPSSGMAPPRGAASCWAGPSRCGVQIGPLASRFTCNAAATGADLTSASVSVAFSAERRGGCRGVALGFGAGAVVFRGQASSVCAARAADSSASRLSPLAGLRRGAGVLGLRGSRASPPRAAQPHQWRLAAAGAGRAGTAASAGSRGGGIRT